MEHTFHIVIHNEIDLPISVQTFVDYSYGVEKEESTIILPGEKKIVNSDSGEYTIGSFFNSEEYNVLWINSGLKQTFGLGKIRNEYISEFNTHHKTYFKSYSSDFTIHYENNEFHWRYYTASSIDYEE